MKLSDLIHIDDIVPALKAGSKKQVLHELAALAGAATGMPARDIFETLLQRERLGSTGLGRGIAIPHGKLPDLAQLYGLFARLSEPVDFDAADGEPVDLVFLLLAPEGAGADHLKALARISRLLRDPGVVKRLRKSSDRDVLFSILTEPLASHAA